MAAWKSMLCSKAIFLTELMSCAAVIRSWAQSDRRMVQEGGPDFVRMNKLAALRQACSQTHDCCSHGSIRHVLRDKTSRHAYEHTTSAPLQCDPAHQQQSVALIIKSCMGRYKERPEVLQFDAGIPQGT